MRASGDNVLALPGARQRQRRPRWPLRLLHWALRCIDRSGSRQRLAELGERELRDMGISRYDVLMEVRKPFWRE